jgi:methionine-gamma-lyase
MIHGKTTTKSWEFSRHLIPPITSATTFRLDSLERGAQGFMSFAGGSGDDPILIYDRLDEPNTMMLEESLAIMEGTECAVTFASGMGAISSAILSCTRQGQKVLAHRTLYGCTYSLLNDWLPRFGIENTFVDMNSPEHRQLLDDPKVRVLYFESVTNPNLELADLPKIMADVKKANRKRADADRIIVIVDNTFATPWALRPAEYGVDLVVESLTKNISGFGTEMGGAVMGAREFERSLKLARKDFGAILNPRGAWQILVHGIPTLAVRYQQQQTTALKVAKWLEKQSKVEQVVYPGLVSHPQHALAKKLLRSPEGEFAAGTMISFTLNGNMRKCQRFVDHIAKHSYSVTLAVSLGVTKTLIEVPGYMTHSAIPSDKQSSSGIDARAIRLSLGLEHAEDIIADLETAIAKI